MAINVFFRKIWEDEVGLEYEFGDAPACTHRRLLIDLATMRAWPGDAREDYQFEAARQRIRFAGQTVSWPERGGVRS